MRDPTGDRDVPNCPRPLVVALFGPTTPCDHFPGSFALSQTGAHPGWSPWRGRPDACGLLCTGTRTHHYHLPRSSDHSTSSSAGPTMTGLRSTNCVMPSSSPSVTGSTTTALRASMTVSTRPAAQFSYATGGPELRLPANGSFFPSISDPASARKLRPWSITLAWIWHRCREGPGQKCPGRPSHRSTDGAVPAQRCLQCPR